MGGMGIVLAATHLHLERRVAVKLLLPEVSRDAEVVARFLQEGRAAARMKSEHVAHVYDVSTTRDRGEPYMIMEYLDGQDLNQLLESRGSLGVEESVDYLIEACEAVAEAHSKGVIHRDLKPSNLFLAVRENGTTCVKVLDFGISKLLHDPNGEAPKMNITKTRSILGSPVYMSPEQLRASKNVDARADIWALGVILYELLAGAPPFDGQTIAELGAQVLAGEVPKLRGRVPVPEELERAILLCLRKNRLERFGSVAAFVDAIARFGSGRALASAARILASSPRLPIDGPSSSERVLSMRPGATPQKSFRPLFNATYAQPGSERDLTQYASGPQLPITGDGSRNVPAGRDATLAETDGRWGLDGARRRTGRKYVLALAAPAFVVMLGTAGVVWFKATRTPTPPVTASTATTPPETAPPPLASIVEPVLPAPTEIPPVKSASADPRAAPIKIGAAPPVVKPVRPAAPATPTAATAARVPATALAPLKPASDRKE